MVGDLITIKFLIPEAHVDFRQKFGGLAGHLELTLAELDRVVPKARDRTLGDRSCSGVQEVGGHGLQESGRLGV